MNNEMLKSGLKAVSGYCNHAIFELKKYSPEILIVTGVIGTVVSAVMACKATTKVSTIIEDAKITIDEIHSVAANEDLAETYTQEDAKKDLAITYFQTGVKLVKLYAPSVILGVISLGSVVASNEIMRKRNVALTAAYTAIHKGFKQYRSRVVDRYGKQVDAELRHGVKATKIDKVITDENGKEKKVKETINVVEGAANDEYHFVFDAGNPYWQKDGTYNRFFLSANQQYANDKLRADGFLYLNDVLEPLGFKKTKAGQLVGWIYDPNNDRGDNYVDFGIYEAYRKDEISFKKAMAAGDITEPSSSEMYERVVILDFNCDGNILELMPDRGVKNRRVKK